MFNSLGTRSALLTGSVAAAAVVIAGVVSMPLIRDAAEMQAQATLSQQADLVQNVASNPHDFDAGMNHPGDLDNDSDDDNAPAPQPSQSANGFNNQQNSARALLGVVSYLKAQGISALPIIPGTSEPKVLSSDEISAIASGKSISGRYCAGTDCSLIEARPVGTGTGIVLVQPTSVASGIKSEALTRIAMALIAGFTVAVLIGLYAARRLTKPLRKAADAAHRLAQGERDFQITPDGPTEIYEIAEALNVLATELEYSEGRQREFLLSISHELRTPLTAIRGYAEAMNDGLVEESELEKVGGVVNAEALRLDRLVADLLDLARTGAVEFPLHIQEIDLRGVVNDASEVWKDRAAREGVIFEKDVTDVPVNVKTDPVRVRQIMDNLAENALRVTPSGEKIIFSLNASGQLQVRDSGPGLSEDDINVAFQPGELYERYKGVRRVGTGFGLALVGRLASRLGATATAGKSPEGGAAFTIDFAALLSQ